MERADPEAAVSVVKLEEISLPWREVARVQTWPEKCMILFYAPAWWLRIPVLCTPFAWEDAAEMIREKLGKKKKVRLPESFRAEAPPRPQRVRPRGPAVPGNAAADEVRQRRDQRKAKSRNNAPDDPVPGLVKAQKRTEFSGIFFRDRPIHTENERRGNSRLRKIQGLEDRGK